MKKCNYYPDGKHQLNYDKDNSDICHSVFTCKCGHSVYEPEDAGTGA